MADQTTYRMGIENDFIDTPLSPMITSGGVLTDGTGVLDISALTALIRTSDSDTGILTKISLGAQTGLTIPICCTLYYTVLKYNDGSPSISIQTGYPNNTTDLCVGKCLRDNSDNIHFCNCGMRLENGVGRLHKRAIQIEYSKLVRGSTISHTGTNNFEMTSGTFYEGINEFTTSSFSSLVGKFTYVYNDGDWQYVENQTTIDNTQYNDYGVGLDTLGGSRRGCHWVYLHPDDGDVYVVYGVGSYTLAQAEIAQPPANLPPTISEFAALIGCIIIKKNDTSFELIQMVTDTVFSGSAAADHNSLSTLQGGQADEYYHMTQDEHTIATQAATDALNGYATSTQITKLDGIAENADVTGDNPPQVHKDSHDPENGGDPLDCAVPEEIAEVQAGVEGNSHSFARSDHVHEINHGITDNHIITVDSTSAIVSGSFAQFTLLGLRDRSPTQVLSTLSGKSDNDFSLNNNNLIDVSDPIDAQDAATKNYVDNSPGGFGPLSNIVKTGNYTLTINEAYNMFVADSTGVDIIFTLPSVGLSEDGIWYCFFALGLDKTYVNASDSDYVIDSGAGQGIYNNGGEYGTLTLMYYHASRRWIAPFGMFGNWTTYIA